MKKTPAIDSSVIEDLLDKHPRLINPHSVLRGTGLKATAVEARCQELYGKSFRELRAERRAADHATKGKGRWYKAFIPGSRQADGAGAMNFG